MEGAQPLVTSVPLLVEAERVLTTKFSYPADQVSAFMGIITRAADVVDPRTRFSVVLADPSDDRILESAVAGLADPLST